MNYLTLPTMPLLILLLVFSTHSHALDDDHHDHSHATDEHLHKHKEVTPDHGDHQDHEDHEDHEGETHQLKFSPAELEEFSIKLTQAKAGVINKTIRLTGEVVIAPERLFHITPRVSGVVQQVFKHLGDPVNKGDLLVTLSSHDLADAKAQLVVTHSLLQQANTTLKREAALFQNKITAKRHYLAAQQAKTAASIHHNAAKQRLMATGLTEQKVTKVLQGQDKNLTLYHLYAPADGIIIKKQLAVGDSVETNSPSMIIADLSQVWINLTVYQKDLPFIKQGQAVSIHSRFDSNNQDSPAYMINWISPMLDEATRSATARIVVDNSSGDWRPGLFVSGQVNISHINAHIVIPQSALQTIEGETVVFVQHKAGEFEAQIIQLGQKNQQHVEVTQGLSIGQTYVSENAFVLKAQSQKSSFGHGHSH
jgi:cobalt-zinc-cadmium efflux system membrane fusion protein